MKCFKNTSQELQFVRLLRKHSQIMKILIVKIMTPRLIMGPKRGLKLSIEIFEENVLKCWNRMMQGTVFMWAMWLMGLLFSWFVENVRHYTVRVTYKSAYINCSISCRNLPNLLRCINLQFWLVVLWVPLLPALIML